jgi:hypothetical protein
MMPLRQFLACSGSRKVKRKYTQISRDARKWRARAVTGLDVSQCRFGRNLCASRLICVHLRFPLLCFGRHARRNARSAYGAAVRLWCAPDRSTGMRQWAGKVPERRLIIVAQVFSLHEHKRKLSSKSSAHRTIIRNSSRGPVIPRVSSTEEQGRTMRSQRKQVMALRAERRSCLLCDLIVLPCSSVIII